MVQAAADEAWIRAQDYHLHTSWSDGEGDLDALITRCREQGVRRFAVTDHVEAGHHSDVSGRWEAYRRALDRARERAAALGMEMLVGIETAVDAAGRLLAPESVVADVDYVICSVHKVAAVPDGPESLPDDAYWPLLQQQVEAGIRSGRVAIIGHIEGYLPAAFGRYGAANFAERRRAERAIAERYFPLEWYARVGELAREHGVAIELHGMSATPRVEAVRVLREHGARFSIGSDAHALRDVGRVDHVVHVARVLGLTRDDFYVPQPKA